MSPSGVAKELGISAIFDELAGKIGFVLLIDSDSKQVVGKLDKTLSKSEMVTLLDRALAR